MDICLFVYKNWNPGLEFFHAPDLVYNQKKEEVQAPSFFIQSIEIKNIILVKVEYSTLYTISRGFLEKINFLLTIAKKCNILVNS